MSIPGFSHSYASASLNQEGGVIAKGKGDHPFKNWRRSPFSCGGSTDREKYRLARAFGDQS